LRVTVLTDVALPLPVNELITSDAVTARAQDMMLARAGVVLQNTEHAAKVFGDGSANVLRQALHRERERHGSDWQPPEHLVRVYRMARAGAHHDEAWFDLTVIGDPAGWLRKNLGAMSYEPEIGQLAMPLREGPLLERVTERLEDRAPTRVFPWLADVAGDDQIAREPPDG
jgi:hypothetical protein